MEVRKQVDAIKAGDRFIFSEEYGGEGEVVTARGGANNMFGTRVLGTWELDFDLEFHGNVWLTLPPGEVGAPVTVHRSDHEPCVLSELDHGDPVCIHGYQTIEVWRHVEPTVSDVIRRHIEKYGTDPT